MAQEQDDRLEAVRKNIARLRKERGLSQAELAERMSDEGVKFFPQTVQKIENGTRTIRLDEAMVLATALDVTVGDLMRPIDSPLVELERAHTIAMRSREQGLHGIQDWLEGIEALSKVLAMLSAEPIEIPDEDRKPWQFLLKNSELLRKETIDDLLRKATAQMELDRKTYAAEAEADDVKEWRQEIGDDDGVDQTAP